MTKSLFAHGKAILCVSFVNWTQLLFILVSGRSFFFFFSNFESPSSAFFLLFMGFFFFFLQRNTKVKTHLPCVSNRLTLHAQPIRAVLGLQDKAIAVLASILGGWCRALPPAPVSALGPAGRPLAPRGPPAIHWHTKKTKTKNSNRSKREGASWRQRGGRAQVETKHQTLKKMPHQGVLHSF